MVYVKSHEKHDLYAPNLAGTISFCVKEDYKLSEHGLLSYGWHGQLAIKHAVLISLLIFCIAFDTSTTQSYFAWEVEFHSCLTCITGTILYFLDCYRSWFTRIVQGGHIFDVLDLARRFAISSSSRTYF